MKYIEKKKKRKRENVYKIGNNVQICVRVARDCQPLSILRQEKWGPPINVEGVSFVGPHSISWLIWWNKHWHTYNNNY